MLIYHGKKVKHHLKKQIPGYVITTNFSPGAYSHTINSTPHGAVPQTIIQHVISQQQKTTATKMLRHRSRRRWGK